jgi:hypothetical protein
VARKYGFVVDAHRLDLVGRCRDLRGLVAAVFTLRRPPLASSCSTARDASS